MKKSLKILLPLLVVAAGAVGAVLLVKAAPEAETVEPSTPPPLVRVIEVERRDLRLDVTTQGTVSPHTEATLVAQVGGRIVEVAPSFAEGGVFREGDVLVRIDPTDYELAVSQAGARVAQAETALARTEAEAAVAREEWEEIHAADGGGSGEPNPLAVREPQLAEARAALESARAQLEQARVNLERTTVEAPFDGRVRAKEADVGQSVSPGTPLGRVFGTDYAEVRLPVPVAQLAYLDLDLTGAMSDGPETALTADLAGARRTWPARIVRTAGAIDADTRMLGLVARVDRPYGNRPGEPAAVAGAPLPMGLFVDATIAGRPAEDVIVLPRSALRERPEASGDRIRGGRTRDPVAEGPEEGALGAGSPRQWAHVLVVDPADGDGPDRLRFRRVRLLRLEGERALISEGLEEGERVAVSPMDAPVDGMAVQVTEDPEGAR